MKYQYLLASFKSEAAALFEHTDLIANNFAITWDILNKRYDYKKALTRECYRKQSFLPTMSSDRVEELAQLVGEFTRLVKGLIKLGEPVDL